MSRSRIIENNKCGTSKEEVHKEHRENMKKNLFMDILEKLQRKEEAKSHGIG